MSLLPAEDAYTDTELGEPGDYVPDEPDGRGSAEVGGGAQRDKKMAKNRARKWQVDGQGCAQHVE